MRVPEFRCAIASQIVEPTEPGKQRLFYGPDGEVANRAHCLLSRHQEQCLPAHEKPVEMGE